MVDRSPSHRHRTSENLRSRQLSISGISIEDSSGNVDGLSYTAEKMIANGSFGMVYLANTAETKEQVAIKKVFQDRRYKTRELSILKELKHPNIISLKHAFYRVSSDSDEVYLNIVTEYIPRTLNSIPKKSCFMVKLYSYQLLKALAHTHAMGVCHRDIQPSNILIDNDNTLKLCDFGSAKIIKEGEANVSYIVSRHYRAPELIFGSKNYGTAIDLWSAACVIAEMIIGKPLFEGNDHVGQIVEIVKVLGTPNTEQIKDMNPEYRLQELPFVRPKRLAKIIKPKHWPKAADLLSTLLRYSPQKRKSAVECLAHPFFDELRNHGAEVPPSFFEFNELELQGLSQEIVDKLTIPVKVEVQEQEQEEEQEYLSEND